MSERDLVAALSQGPLLLNADNFTPLTRTPWGGEVIARTYKRELFPTRIGQRIGEAWEFSVGPAFPSRALAFDLTLAEIIDKCPEAVLSPELVSERGAECDILVKLLDAGEPLSLQVHPADDDPNLAPGECGKPESWLVLNAAPGSGLYLGFSRPVGRVELEQALQDGDRAKNLLQFVPVRPGDYFEIEPGVPHAIGPGVTLLEPQRTKARCDGKTFRLWDWGRRYSADGKVDPAGDPRELHLGQSLRLVDPGKQVGLGFVRSLRRVPKGTERPGGVRFLEFPANPYYKTLLCQWSGASELRFSVQGGYAAILVLSGSLTTTEGATMLTGQPALLAHAAGQLRARTQGRGQLAAVIPARATVIY